MELSPDPSSRLFNIIISTQHNAQIYALFLALHKEFLHASHAFLIFNRCNSPIILHWQIFFSADMWFLLLKSFRFVPFCSFSKKGYVSFCAKWKKGKIDTNGKKCACCVFLPMLVPCFIFHCVPLTILSPEKFSTFSFSHKATTTMLLLFFCSINWQTNNYNFPHFLIMYFFST